MSVLLCNVVYCVVIPIVLFYFFCLYSSIVFDWKYCCCYVLCSVLLFCVELYCNNAFYWLFVEILLLSYCGRIVLKGMFVKTLLIATLVHSVYSICQGVMQMAFFWLFTRYYYSSIMQYIDNINVVMTLIFTVCLLLLLSKYFDENVAVNHVYLCLLIIPIFFISLVERIVSNSVYGNTIVMNDTEGIVFPVVHHISILLLQLFAILCLFTSLVAYQNIKKSLCAQQTIQLLKQQYHFQQNYIQEAQMRYENTRSFRHDIKNHMTVLSELLKQNLLQQAQQYLYQMEELSENLSFTVQTGNAVVNALLSSKLSIAKQKGIKVECDLTIPQNIKEIDCCIVLSNAIDNAITENNTVAQIQNRFITIKSSQKGNVYMLSIKNKCHEGMTVLPDMGVGLCNIKSICEKYGGAMHIELQNEVYHISMLFFIS